MAQSHKAPGVRRASKPHTPILRRTSARFPLTPALSLGEREIRLPSRDESEHFRCATYPGERCSLSLGERAGVRGNGPYSNRTSQTLAGTVKLFESSGRAGGLPSDL